MFWSDRTADTISRAKLNGSEVTVLVNSGLSTIGNSTTNESCLEYEWMCKLHYIYIYISSNACMNLNMHLTSSYM